jgi:flagellar P-ring protein precursor FlgI
MNRSLRQLGFALAVLLLPALAHASRAAVAVRLKDIARIQEVRSNQLYGIGIVVGLNGTGDGGKLTPQLMSNMLEKLRITIPETDLDSDNVATVMVTAEVPAFLTEGSKIDVVLSSFGDAASLSGGTLLQTPLQGADGNVYAVAQGPLSTGAFSASGEAASVTKNHPTVGRIPGGAIVERSISTVIRPTDDVHLVLNSPDFTTAVRAANAIDELFPDAARPLNAGLIRVTVPAEYRSSERLADFLYRVQEVRVIPDSPARVVVNERTGTIVAGENVKLSAVAISHGNLTISIKETSSTSQPNPLGAGETRTDKSTDISASEPKAGLYVVEDAATLAEVARALNLLGVTPRDMVSIFQALKEAGALQGELVII